MCVERGRVVRARLYHVVVCEVEKAVSASWEHQLLHILAPLPRFLMFPAFCRIPDHYPMVLADAPVVWRGVCGREWIRKTVQPSARVSKGALTFKPRMTPPSDATHDVSFHKRRV